MDAPTRESDDLARLRIAREPERPRRARRRRRGPGLGVLLLLVAAGLAAFLFWPKIRGLVESFRAPEVATAVVRRTNPNEALELTSASGYVVARVRAALASRHAGRLVELLADVGDKVEAGRLLARIEPDVWTHEVAQLAALVDQADAEAKAAEVMVLIAEKKVLRLKSALAETQAVIREAEATLAEAERVLELEERLAREGAGTADALKKAASDAARMRASRDRAAAGADTLHAEIASAEAEVRGAEARIGVAEAAAAAARARHASAQVDLEDTEVRAPFAGVILRKEAELGEIVVPALAGGTTSRGAIFTMAEFASLEMELDVFERDIARIESGGAAETTLDAYPGVVFPGHVRQIVPTADRAKGTVTVKVAFDRPDERIFPEMSGRTTFLSARPAEARRPVVLAPSRAVVRLGTQEGVFEVAGPRVRFRPVTITERREGSVVVEQGLEGGETVVVDPPAGLADNMVVQRKGDDG